mgnify:CR=1 FL=1
MTRHPLAPALGAAVQLEILRLRAMPPEQRQRFIAQHTGQDAARMLAEHGDELLFGGDHCRQVFTEVAATLACLAWAPGGVNVLGMHLCANHAQCTGDAA